MVMAKVVGIVTLWIVALLPVKALAQGASGAPDKLLVGTLVAPPFMMKTASGRWEGLSIELWHAVAQDLEVGYELREYTRIGQILDAVEKGKLDVVLGLAQTEKREIILDFSNSYYKSGSAIAVPAKSTGYGWLRIAEHLVSMDFLKVISLLILLWLIAGAIVWLFEGRRNREMFGGGTVKGIGQGMWWAAVTMTTVGYGDKAPKTLGGRMVALVWMLASIILIASFTATITTHLTVSELSGKVRGLSDLPNVRVGSVAQSESWNFLVERGIVAASFGNDRDGLQAMVEDRIDAFVYNEAILKYLVKTEFLAQVQVLPGIFDHYFVGMAMPQGSELREPINRALLKFTGSADWRRLVQHYIGSG
jgi:ABC-type amino acid transport substrate-binding protein